MDNARAGLGLVRLWNSRRDRIVPQIKPEQLKELEAQGQIGWFTHNRKTRPYLKAEASFDPFKSNRFKY